LEHEQELLQQRNAELERQLSTYVQWITHVKRQLTTHWPAAAEAVLQTQQAPPPLRREPAPVMVSQIIDRSQVSAPLQSGAAAAAGGVTATARAQSEDTQQQHITASSPAPATPVVPATAGALNSSAAAAGAAVDASNLRRSKRKSPSSSKLLAAGGVTSRGARARSAAATPEAELSPRPKTRRARVDAPAVDSNPNL